MMLTSPILLFSSSILFIAGCLAFHVAFKGEKPWLLGTALPLGFGGAGIALWLIFSFFPP